MIRKLRLAFLASALLVSSCSEETVETQDAPAIIADLIFVGDNILTMEDDAEPVGALAVKGETILAVGTREDILKHQGEATRLIELGDKALLPGFIDAHGHLGLQMSMIDFANVAPPPVGKVNTIEDLVNEIAAFREARQIPAGAWIVASGYDDSLLAEQRHPNRNDLDRAAPDNPVAILHVSLHMGVVNSAALEILKIDGSTPSPKGGEIVHFEDTGEPTGLLQETAFQSSFRNILGNGPGDPTGMMSKTLEYYASQGITTIQDGAAAPQIVAMFERAAESGLLKQDVAVYPVLGNYTTDELIQLEYGTYKKRFKIGGVKMILDGSPQGKTAYLTKAYHVPPAGKANDYRGYPQMDSETLNAAVSKLYEHNIPIIVHANGDAAADQLIAAVEQAHAASPGDHRPVMIHAQTVRDDQLDRMKEIGMIPSFFSAHVFYWGDWHRDSVLGEERGAKISPTATSLAKGVTFTLHNDAPVVPPNMARLLWATVNRTTRSGVVLGPSERISAYDAVSAVTKDAAFQYFEENTKGTLAVGKQADMIIVDQGPTQMAPEKINEMLVLETFSHGESIYRREP